MKMFLLESHWTLAKSRLLTRNLIDFRIICKQNLEDICLIHRVYFAFYIWLLNSSIVAKNLHLKSIIVIRVYLFAT